MKNSLSASPNGWALQLAPNPLNKLLSETSSFQLDGPNSRPLQLARPQLDGMTSKPLQLARPQLASRSELREYELGKPNACSQLDVISPRPACQLASVSLPRAKISLLRP